jgi:hypothetical protein
MRLRLHPAILYSSSLRTRPRRTRGRNDGRACRPRPGSGGEVCRQNGCGTAAGERERGAGHAEPASSTGIQPAVNLAAEQKAQAGQQPASVGPKYTGEPISVNLKDVDLKDFFRLIHEISG